MSIKDKSMERIGEMMAQMPYIGEYVAGNLWAEIAVIIIVTFVVAEFVKRIVIGVLRVVTAHTSTTTDDRVLGALQRPLFYSVVFGGVIAMAHASGMPEGARTFLVTGSQTVLVLLWTLFGFHLMRAVLYKSKDVPNVGFIKEQTIPLFENAFAIIAVAAAAYLTFVIWGIDMTAWLASAGVVGIAVGFAAKDTLANLFSGVFIIADAPYKIGDYIVLDSGERGEVTHIGIRSTRMLTRDDVEVTIPNAVMGNAKIINESGGPVAQFRVRVEIGVAYGSDLDVVERELLAAAADSQFSCEDPAPRARLTQFGASSVDYVLLYWVQNPADRGQSRHEVNRAIYKRFHDAGVHIPFPQRDVHIVPKDVTNSL